jgi:hypothetical protein
VILRSKFDSASGEAYALLDAIAAGSASLWTLTHV